MINSLEAKNNNNSNNNNNFEFIKFIENLN